MKKFGTPIGAGPGSANEKVGFAAVGTPGPVGPFGVCGLREPEVLVEPWGPVGPLVPLGFFGPVGPEAPVVPFRPLDPEPLWPPWLAPEPFCRDGGGELVVVGVVAGVDGVLGVVGGAGAVVVVVVVVGAHEALTPLIGPTPAGTIAEGAVPGGTLTLKVSVWPLTSVTVTVHSSAEADGIAAIPITPRTVTSEMRAVFSLRLLDNLTRLLPGTDDKPSLSAA